MEREGRVEVEKVGGRSTVTRCFSKYPLKFIIPRKVGPSKTDAVWVYNLTYGGGIVSGDSISCEFNIGDGCTTVLTTQASTKGGVQDNDFGVPITSRGFIIFIPLFVYKSVGFKCCEQVLEARVGSNALLAVIPDPVTCFSTARYSQKQVFRVVSDSSLVIVDWITSGRHESGEKWDFDLYKSINHIFMENDEPLFLDAVHLERGNISSIAERMQDYQVIAMVVLLGPKIKHIQNLVQENVKRIMSDQLHIPSTASGHQIKTNSDNRFAKPSFIASSSVFGPKGIGVVVRVAATTTESVYKFLQHQLAGMEPLLGVSPYH
ncbi:urease accessory protein D isoform X1 [Malus domestica]|uniref:urease accessory protein D isoform X1 n=1 Tax=Malus domestica TaxID=3750 RepID=UPI000498CE7F|nr:urease accessory protein D isoform X1 [Malus domestica]